jgi:ribosome-associated protein
MTSEELRNRISEGEFLVLTSRSSGPGGQNVNKVNTKVEIHFNISLSSGLSDTEKERILRKLKNRINSEGELVVRSQSERTQLNNRKKAIERLFLLLSECLTERPPRKPTKPTMKSKTDRLDKKKKRGRIKRLRSDDTGQNDFS